MCTFPEVAVNVCTVLALFLLMWSFYLERSFKQKLQRLRPDQWAELGTAGFSKWDENPKEMALEWYLLTGRYKTQAHPDLVRLGDQARFAGLACIAVACIAFCLIWLPSFKAACFL